MKKVIFILGAIVVLVLLAGTCSQQIKETYKNINEKENCMNGCAAVHFVKLGLVIDEVDDS